MYKIYKLTAPDNRVYIGCTCRELKVRFGYQGSGYQGCPRMWEAIQKFGWDSFTIEVLEICESGELARSRESYYIEEYRSYEIEFGFNMKSKSNALTDEQRKVCSEIQRSVDVNMKRSSSLRRTALLPESHKRRSNAASRDWNNVDSKHRTAAYKIQQSESHKKFFSDPSNRKVISDSIKALHQDPNSTYNSVAYQKQLKSRLQSKEFKDKRLESFRKTLSDPNSYINSEEYRQKQIVGMNRPEVRKKLSVARLGRKSIWKFDEDTGTYLEKQVLPDSLSDFLEKGWALGQSPIRRKARKEASDISERKYIHRFCENRLLRKRVLVSDLDSYLNQGWSLGMGPISYNKER